MYTHTHFTQSIAPHTGVILALPPASFRYPEQAFEQAPRPRFHVVLAGNAFFHIKETSSGRVRGFRADHNEACALARFLETRF
ncbi:hypothetical protein [Pseudomonas vancouverensis]|uniref:Uncharacterized protein n=1 Tax=Pseudomonas vancouverensis TaxID=95300 RepID=A0A1H2N1J9_PSEVA|nr:hypothetical protein [Pseudomonas vancouverensis]KAB0495682.1 hypothetical protein F7R09_14130 [Pseudomonas vancouverensis]TDB65484.1 hypothetical protein EIY72_08190 [Pseudomonas vancouverensis]SDU98656.1 hypothetical protein SAMN05216558_1505 [Pseudomonas vancouverensis]